jgi:hypothetical protein
MATEITIMTTTLGELDLESAAKKAAGNHRNFICFAWFREKDVESPDDWTIVYTHHRDSGLLDQSNADVIAEAMRSFSEGDDPDVVFESHHHWAVGHVDGFSIRVFEDGEITEAFRTYHELSERIADYPILDKQDYSEREYEATLENITNAAWRLERNHDLPGGWECEVYSWLSDHECGEVENVDDQGGYPSEEALRRAFKALGYRRAP